MSSGRPDTFDDLLSTWRRRAEDHETSAKRFGLATYEGRVMQADAAAVRLCIKELLGLLTDLGPGLDRSPR